MSFFTLSNFQQRLILGSISILLTLLAIYVSHINVLGALFFTLFISGVVGAALWEYYRIAQTKGCQPLFKIGVSCSFAFFFALLIRTYIGPKYMLPETVIGLTLGAGFAYYFIKGMDPFTNLAVTFFGILYLTIPLGCLITVNFFVAPPYVVDGRWCLLYLLLVTKGTDIGAYFVGKLIGSRPLSPYISPKKTWEGALGGLVFSIFISYLFFLAFTHLFEQPPFAITLAQTIWLATLISIVAQFGDLAESLLKRDVGIKDSSRHLPGLGGFLDSLDSLVFTSPLMYIFLNLQTKNLL